MGRIVKVVGVVGVCGLGLALATGVSLPDTAPAEEAPTHRTVTFDGPGPTLDCDLGAISLATRDVLEQVGADPAAYDDVVWPTYAKLAVGAWLDAGACDRVEVPLEAGTHLTFPTFTVARISVAMGRDLAQAGQPAAAADHLVSTWRASSRGLADGSLVGAIVAGVVEDEVVEELTRLAPELTDAQAAELALVVDQLEDVRPPMSVAADVEAMASWNLEGWGWWLWQVRVTRVGGRWAADVDAAFAAGDTERLMAIARWRRLEPGTAYIAGSAQVLMEQVEEVELRRSNHDALMKALLRRR